MISNSLFLKKCSFSEVSINKREAMRYLQVKGEISESFETLFEECLKEFAVVVAYKSVVAPVAICTNGNKLDLSFGVVESGNLAKNLEGCKNGFVFAATLGSGVDRLIGKYSLLSPAKGMIIDAIASAAIEDFCDKVNFEFADGKEKRHRFSPGYGDLRLDVQPAILEYLDAYRKIGITLSKDYFMTPMKSVTAIFGVNDGHSFFS